MRRRSDADLFENHGFPVAASDADPWPAQIGPKRRMRRPGVRALQHLDAVLRALAALCSGLTQGCVTAT